MKLTQLHPNVGQLYKPDDPKNSVPSNPRQITEQDFAALTKSLRGFRKMLQARPIVTDENGIILGGNMRYQALCRLRDEHAKIGAFEFTDDIPDEWVLRVTNWSPKEKREFIIKDNQERGENDWDKLANEWDDTELAEWDLMGADWGQNDGSDENGGYQIEDNDEHDSNGYKEREKIESAEKLLDSAMQEYCGEFAERVEYCMRAGFLPWGKTPAYAKIQFLKSKYYGCRYERSNSLIFCPRQFYTSANKQSYYDQMVETSKTGAAGLAGFRSHTNDGNLEKFFADNYPIGGSRMPLDFPVSLARELIAEFANGGRVLDPCHGWGGRCTAALLEGVREYVGVDPSPVAHEGVQKIYDTFREYQQTKVVLVQSPYEDAEIEGGFDFALTSPPYFDVEQYEGEQQAHERYNNYTLWVEKFYKPLIVDTMRRLKDGCVFALQVGSQKYPLRDDAIRIATENGFNAEIYNTQVYGNGLHGTDDDESESIVIIRK